MTGPPDLHELLDPDLPDDQVDALRRADRLLRTVPAPPAELPDRLTARVAAVSARPSPRARRRARGALALAAALAVALAGVSFALGYRAGDESFETVRTVRMLPTDSAPHASASIRLGPADERSGNWEMVVEVSGLPRLPGNDYYILWLAKDGRYAATCGTFNVAKGTTRIRLSASYTLAEFDDWVISARPKGPDDRPAWLLRAPAS